MHPWKARLLVGLIMIVLSFIGLVTTTDQQTANNDFFSSNYVAQPQ